MLVFGELCTAKKIKIVILLVIGYLSDKIGRKFGMVKFSIRMW